MQSTTISASVQRINALKFTEADTKSLFIYARSQFGGVTREIGDFIAHPERDRGKLHKSAVIGFGQMEFFIKYQGDNKQAFPTNGDCDWWLKPLLLWEARQRKQKNLKRTLGVSVKVLLREISSYFPTEPFPTKLVKFDQRFYNILQNIRNIIRSDIGLFSYDDVRREALAICDKFDIKYDQSIRERFILSAILLLHNINFSLPNGARANTYLGATDQQNNGRKTICLMVDTFSQAHAAQPRIAYPIIPTDIILQSVFEEPNPGDGSSFSYGDGLRGLNSLGFDSTREKPIFVVS